MIGCAMAALAGVYAHALVDFPLQVASIDLYVTVYLALAWSTRRSQYRGGDADMAGCN